MKDIIYKFYHDEFGLLKFVPWFATWIAAWVLIVVILATCF